MRRLLLRKMFSVLLISISLLIQLAGCTNTTFKSSTQIAANFLQRQNVITISKEKLPPKSPQLVALYSQENQPMMPYRVIGIATVARHNLIGLSRQDSTIQTMMKKLAASVGGDGLINVSNGKEDVQATIIQYQKILI